MLSASLPGEREEKIPRRRQTDLNISYKSDFLFIFPLQNCAVIMWVYHLFIQWLSTSAQPCVQIIAHNLARWNKIKQAGVWVGVVIIISPMLRRIQIELIKSRGIFFLIAWNDRRHCLSFITIMTQFLIFQHHVPISLSVYVRFCPARVCGLKKTDLHKHEHAVDYGKS